MIASSRVLYPAHSAFSAWISDTSSSVVRELVSSFSSRNTDTDNIPFQSHLKKKQLFLLEKCAFSNILRPCKGAKILVWGKHIETTVAHLNPAACSPVWWTGPVHSALKSDNPLLSDQHPSHPGTGSSQNDYSKSVSPDKHLYKTASAAKHFCRRHKPDQQNKSFACHRFSP